MSTVHEVQKFRVALGPEKLRATLVPVELHSVLQKREQFRATLNPAQLTAVIQSRVRLNAILDEGIPVSGLPGLPRVIQDEGVSLPVRSIIDMRGTGVTATDDGANDKTIITIPGNTGNAVTSVFTRTGAITAQAGDYTVAQVTGAVPDTRTIIAGTGLTGGGALSGNVTLNANIAGIQTPWLQPVSAAGFALTDAPLFQSVADMVFGVGAGTPERMRITAAGNVGIGNAGTAPFAAAGYLHTIIGPAAGSVLPALTMAASGTPSGGLVNFANYAIPGSDKRIASIHGDTSGAADSGALVFDTWNLGVFGERVRITAAGNVGIGNTAPGTALHVGADTFGGEGGGQLWLTAKSDATKRMAIGYNVSNNTTFIDSVIAGAAAVNLILNPSHGMVYLSAVNLGVTALPNQFITFTVDEAANKLTVYARYSTGVLKTGNVALA